MKGGCHIKEREIIDKLDVSIKNGPTISYSLNNTSGSIHVWNSWPMIHQFWSRSNTRHLSIILSVLVSCDASLWKWKRYKLGWTYEKIRSRVQTIEKATKKLDAWIKQCENGHQSGVLKWWYWKYFYTICQLYLFLFE